jgi:hypothetical protein
MKSITEALYTIQYVWGHLDLVHDDLSLLCAKGAVIIAPARLAVRTSERAFSPVRKLLQAAT